MLSKISLVLLASFLLAYYADIMECGSQTMQAVQIRNPETMFIDTLPRVSLRSEKDVLIHVKAAGVNRADVLQRKGASV